MMDYYRNVLILSYFSKNSKSNNNAIKYEMSVHDTYHRAYPNNSFTHHTGIILPYVATI